ncbi:MAG: signal recognition particle receptor subunit alpha, partial [Planctomycetota bacterium]|nr:signal recognition particle receptor subunit alpha [Planctomycetota bacterium]
MGLFDKLKKSLQKTREVLTGGLVRVFRGKLDEDKLEEIEEALLGADVGVTTTDVLVEALRAAWKKGDLTEAEDALPFLKERLVERLTVSGTELIEA